MAADWGSDCRRGDWGRHPGGGHSGGGERGRWCRQSTSSSAARDGCAPHAHRCGRWCAPTTTNTAKWGEKRPDHTGPQKHPKVRTGYLSTYKPWLYYYIEAAGVTMPIRLPLCPDVLDSTFVVCCLLGECCSLTELWRRYSSVVHSPSSDAGTRVCRVPPSTPALVRSHTARSTAVTP